MLYLSNLFTDHAVFQRGKTIPVWGKTEPRCPVECEFRGRTYRTFSTTEGKFRFRLAPENYGGPYNLHVKNLESGESLQVKDIMIGEVWVASGQSNMEFKLWQVSDVEQHAHPAVRMVTLPHVARIGGSDEFLGEWQTATAENTPEFSAVGYFFARELAEKLGITVGIIHSSWGGTIAEAWSSRNVLMRNPDYRDAVELYEAEVESPSSWSGWKNDVECFGSSVETMKIFKEMPVPANEGAKQGWQAAELDDSTWPVMRLPGTWQCRGENYSGVFWFRRTVEIPAEWAGHDLTLAIGAVDKQDVTYFNGVEVGATGKDFEEHHWNERRFYTVPGKLVKPGINTIAVRAFSFIYGGGLIGPCAAMYIAPVGEKDERIELYGDWKFKVELNIGLITPEASQPVIAGGNPNLPYNLFENMVVPLLPYAIAGVIWYQGESNANNAAPYRRLMSDLIDDWRRAWGQGDFPFYQVQLANYMGGLPYDPKSTWALIRDAQLKAGRERGCGLAVAVDIGEEADIHPKDKVNVGLRLARLALHNEYGRREVVPEGPLFAEMTRENSGIRLRFTNCDGGLELRKSQTSEIAFYVSGPDRVFHPADAVAIDGDSVVLTCAAVERPVAVRYAWADNPVGNLLYNGAGLPASPFRTDTWE